jgi:hypothetical protein
MQIVLKCKYCGQLSVSEDAGDFCLEIDAFEGQIRFVCRAKGCKKPNCVNLSPKRPERDPLPSIGVSRY